MTGSRRPPRTRPTRVELEAVFLRAWAASERDLSAALEAYREAVLGSVLYGVEPKAFKYAHKNIGAAAVSRAATPILERVAERNGTTVDEMLSPTRLAILTLPRLEAMWCLREIDIGYQAIATVMNRKDHTTVLKQLQRFHPTAEQERALREIAGVEQVEPKLAAVA